MTKRYTDWKTTVRISLIILIALGLFGFSKIVNPENKTLPVIEYGVYSMPTKVFLQDGSTLVVPSGTPYVSCIAMDDFLIDNKEALYISPKELDANADYCFRIFNDDFED